jgi:hypothetical protein
MPSTSLDEAADLFNKNTSHVDCLGVLLGSATGATISHVMSELLPYLPYVEVGENPKLNSGSR